MKIVEKKISEIKEYENNPRNNDNAVDKVAASIKEFGFKIPIIIDKNNVIVCGHTRVKAALKLGMKTVPSIVADDLNDEQIKAFRIADNKVSEFSTWDFEKLEKELAGLDFDMSGFGMDKASFDRSFESMRQPAPSPTQAPVAPSVQSAAPAAVYEAPEIDDVDESVLPEELQGVNIIPDELPKTGIEGQTITERIIITYKKEQKELLEQKLGIDISKVIYTFEELNIK